MPAQPRSRPIRILRFLLWCALGWVAVTWGAVLLMRFIPPLTSAMMLERRLGALFTGEPNFQFRHRWVPASETSPLVGLAMVASEDQKFPFHHGFDVDAIQDALDAADDGRRLRGASTISQQTAKNLFLWNGRSFVRKGLEAYFTVLIELTWPKRRILEVYTNIVELGDGIYGVGAASDVFYRTAPSRISTIQAARLAAVLPNPRKFRVDKPSAYVDRRTAWIAQQMAQLGGPAYVTLDHPARPRGR
jgi:monofunctional biosynthetic peptidoglycan transglycosylase